MSAQNLFSITIRTNDKLLCATNFSKRNMFFRLFSLENGNQNIKLLLVIMIATVTITFTFNSYFIMIYDLLKENKERVTQTNLY